MKRSRLRRKSKKAKAWKDDDLLAEFRKAVPHDELERHLCGPVWEQVKSGWHIGNDLHTHHIFHAGKRVDSWHNLVRATARAHHYCHRDPIGSTVAAMYAVLIRRPWEYDSTIYTTEGTQVHRLAYRSEVRASWRESSGMDVIGDLECEARKPEFPEHYLETAQSILEMF